MRKNTPLFFLLIAGIVLFCSTSSYAVGVGSANVKFGKPDKENNCAGKGICMLSSIETGATIPVSFSYVPGLSGEGFNTLTLQFSIEALEQKDKDYLYTYFLYPTGRPRLNYRFDLEYVFNNTALCEALGIAPGQVKIKPTDESIIETVFNTDVRITYRLMD
jgi:hypothetical protein